MNAHPAGPRHAEIQAAPHLAQQPRDPAAVARIPANVFPRNAVRDESGELTIAGVGVGELAETFGTPLFVLDEDDFRSRCRDMVAALSLLHI